MIWNEAIAGRYLIAQNLRAGIDHFQRDLIGEWTIAFSDDLDITEVRNGDTQVGWLLGVVVDLAVGAVANDVLTLDSLRSIDAEWREICTRCAGSWLYIAIDGDELEFRPDASATVGLVYDPVKREVSSYAFQILGDAYYARLNAEECEKNDVAGDGWFLGGMTAHSRIHRLLPNHAISTRNFLMRRLPLSLPEYDYDTDRHIFEIAAEIKDVVVAVSKYKATQIALTGGNETRALLAALREQAGSLAFVTVGFEASKLDVHLSQRLARTYQLHHTILSPRQADQNQADAWLLGAGHAVGGYNKKFFPSLEPLAGHVLIGGFGGEAGRGFLWPEYLSSDVKISAELVLARLKQPRTPANLEVVAQWHQALPLGLDSFQLLDLAYLELRMGPWAFAQPRMRVVPRSIHPLISYNQFARMWSIDPALRKSDQFIRLIIETLWSDLLQIPINKYDDWRDLLDFFSKAAKRPDKIARKFRQYIYR